MQKQGFFKKIKTDAVFRNRFTLTFTFIWGLLLTVYYTLIGIYSSIQQDPWTWSWFLSLAVWYLIIVIFKLLLMINAFRIKREKWIDFKLLTIIYMFINLSELLIITTYPSFFLTTFGSKLNTPVTVSSIIISSVNIFLFVLNWISIKRENFTRNEADFLQCKQYIGRTEGIFNILIITINILLLCKISNQTISYIALGVGISFEIISLTIAIKLIKQRKWDKTHKN